MWQRRRYLAVEVFLNTFSTFHLYSGGGEEGMYCQQIAWKRLKSAFGNKSICVMGIISYPQFALQLLSNRNFFNVWEHFRFSLFLIINIFNIEKDFRLFSQKIVFIFQKHRFYTTKDDVLEGKSYVFAT